MWDVLYIYTYIMYIHILFNETLQLPHYFLHKKTSLINHDLRCPNPTSCRHRGLEDGRA